MTTVLVVEDELINWRVFQKILTKVGGLGAKHTEDVEEVTICTSCSQSQR
jgi:CheY-like chemotaxis protein